MENDKHTSAGSGVLNCSTTHLKACDGELQERSKEVQTEDVQEVDS